MRDELDGPPIILTKQMRRIVEAAIKDLCRRREYVLYAVNVRSNHAHSVVFANKKPERIADALKANATKMLRENSLIDPETKVWSRGRSRRYLWKPHHLAGAIDYVLYCQSDMPFDLED
ncbi:MAG TPA: transposase [Pyrinomonadaceae bacterium]|nr:transposase [Pyrinomonadaceae bacterium]